MILVSWHVLLGVLWTALTPSYTVPSFMLGVLVAHLALRVSHGRPASTRKIRLFIGFLGFFAKEVVVSAVRVAVDALAPRPRLRPAVVELPLDVRTEGQITLLAILITLTPGTLALDVSSDRRTLYLHAMFAADADRVRRDIKLGFERRVLELAR
jgi:multicomponent Na+:H+ antiporter subunit E